MLASASLHSGEEPPLVGEHGSGMIFVSGCNLRCAFCQNFQISHCGIGGAREGSVDAVGGRIVSDEEFTAICLALKEAGAANINIVTGSHAIPAIARGLTLARRRGVDLPVLWNSSAYETPESLALLDPLPDIFLPDLKTLSPALAKKYFGAPDYGEAATRAIGFMLNHTPLIFEGEALKRGVIIRHLILPGELESTRLVLKWFAENAKGRALLSLMSQYTPVETVPAVDIPRRALSEDEYAEVLRYLDDFQIDDGYIQELIPGSDWLPDFERQNPFSSALSTPIWHWRSPTSPFLYLT
jgi:putative pyruvate formate lyase activating enzyme